LGRARRRRFWRSAGGRTDGRSADSAQIAAGIRQLRADARATQATTAVRSKLLTNALARRGFGTEVPKQRRGREQRKGYPPGGASGGVVSAGLRRLSPKSSGLRRDRMVR